MEKLTSIFKKLELKKQLIIKYEGEFENLNNLQDKLSPNEFDKRYKSLAKSYKKEMKAIDF